MTSSSIFTRNVLSSLKIKDLKLLALSIGAISSGTKDVLSSAIWDKLHQKRAQHDFLLDKAQNGTGAKLRENKILSIDMGIKNFAYSTIALPQQWGVPFNLNGASVPLAASQRRPKLLEWNRLNMLTYDNSHMQDAEAEQPRDRFSPENLARFANHIMELLVLNSKSPGGAPDIVLIERQRFRTMGSSIVQEWTLRVNMLEAMLWALLQAGKQRGIWHGEVYGVSPSLVAGWWQARNDVEDLGYEPQKASTKSEKLSTRQKKQIRIERAAACLSNVVEIPDPAARATYEAYLRRMSRARGQQTTNASVDGEHLQKLDDLADCLLQGLTWLAWEQNRRALLMADSAAEAMRQFSPGD